MKKALSGYLPIDKPPGWTSFDVVNKIRGLLARELNVKPRSLKVGHSGTLDPAATGLLLVLVGAYTKRQSYFLKLDKTYEAEVVLGRSSSTDDGEGKILEVSPRAPKPAEINAVLESFLGRQDQVPPRYSAIKVRGRPAHRRARAGGEFKLSPRPITVYSIEGVSYKYPILSFICRVSSGTYIRALARDLGQRLGTGAYLGGLRRTAIGDYSLTGAVTLERLNRESVRPHLRSLALNNG